MNRISKKYQYFEVKKPARVFCILSEGGEPNEGRKEGRQVVKEGRKEGRKDGSEGR